MQGFEAKASRKALAALLGFLARGEVVASAPAAGSAQIRIERSDGASRKVDTHLLAAALARGLLVDAATISGEAGRQLCYKMTPEGRAALRRWLSDPDSAFQDQHRTLTSRTDPDHGRLAINLRESPLAALARIKARDGTPFLDPAEVEAGERLRVDFTRAQMQPSLGQRWEPVGAARRAGAAGGAVEMSEAAMAARRRVERALADVGPELSGVLVDVCCFLKGLAEVERERQWPVRSAKLMLRTALAALARHYSGKRGQGVRLPPARPPHAP